jgi:hypothetical protein
MREILTSAQEAIIEDFHIALLEVVTVEDLFPPEDGVPAYAHERPSINPSSESVSLCGLIGAIA